MVVAVAIPNAFGEESGRSAGPADCGKPVSGTTPTEACPSEPSPETGSALARQHQKRLLIFGGNALAAAGVMTVGVLTRNEPGWRAFSVTSATLGGTLGGMVIGGFASEPCSGALCGLGQAAAMVVGGLVGAAAGFGGGMWLSSERGGGRVAATGVGVGTYLVLAALASFNNWDRLDPPSHRD